MSKKKRPGKKQQPLAKKRKAPTGSKVEEPMPPSRGYQPGVNNPPPR